MNIESYRFTLNMCLVIGKNPVTMKICVVLHFKPLSLRCEMTVMPQNQVSGCDRVISELILDPNWGFVPFGLVWGVCLFGLTIP